MRPDTTDEASRAAEVDLHSLGPRIDRVLFEFLADRRSEIAAVAPESVLLVDEIVRLLRAGGKRVRPALCYWGYRAAGRPDAEEILRPAAALELLHTFALIHDDVMDEAEVRRGVEASHRFLTGAGATGPAAASGAGGDAGERSGRAAAILVGDLCAALADELLLDASFPPEVIAPAIRRFNRMRMEMAAGQFLDISAGPDADERTVRRISALKTGSYTIEGPLHVGAILGGGSIELLAMLSRFGAPLGEAFQIRDDLEALLRPGGDREVGANIVVAIAARLATPAERGILENPGVRAPGDVEAIVASTGAAFRAAELRDELVARARAGLDPSVIPDQAMRALEGVAALVASPEV
jgi:geranylgeranyl diphosphate synthase type I